MPPFFDYDEGDGERTMRGIRWFSVNDRIFIVGADDSVRPCLPLFYKGRLFLAALRRGRRGEVTPPYAPIAALLSSHRHL